MGISIFSREPISSIVEFFFRSCGEERLDEYVQFCWGVHCAVIEEQKRRLNNFLKIIEEKESQLGRKLSSEEAFNLECSLPIAEQFQGADLRFDIRKQVVFAMLGKGPSGFVNLDLGQADLKLLQSATFFDCIADQLNASARKIRTNDELHLENAINPQTENANVFFTYDAILSVSCVVCTLIEEKQAQLTSGLSV